MGKVKTREWWNTFFTDFRPLFDKVTPQESRNEANFFLKKLNLKKGKSFLDCPVGIGRIAIPMAKKGIQVTGVDITASYIVELEKLVSQKKLPIKLYLEDMRKIQFENKFDAAGNLWTSFGYFEKESENLLVVKKLFKALKPGGKVALQTINKDWIMKEFTPDSWYEGGGMKILEKRKFDYEKAIMRSVWIYIKDGLEKTYEVDLRMYSFHELKQMFEKVGFINVTGYGSIKEEKISRDKRDMFIFADKPKT